MAQTIPTHADFQKEVLEFDGVVLVDFYADRCGPCRILWPEIEKLAESYSSNSQVKVLKLNIDENSESAGQYSVMSIPTVLIFKWWELKHQDVWVNPREVYENKINMLLK